MDFLEEITYTLGKENNDNKEGRKRLNLKEGDKVAFIEYITEKHTLVLCSYVIE